MPRGADLIGHVMKTIKKSDEVEIAFSVAHRVRDFKSCVSYIARLCALPRDLNGRGVIAIANEFCIREGLCHQYRACAVTTADIGSAAAAFELLHDSAPVLQLGIEQVGGVVAGTEEPLGPVV